MVAAYFLFFAKGGTCFMSDLDWEINIENAANAVAADLYLTIRELILI